MGTCCTGKDTKFTIPDFLFSNPKSYEIKKILKNDLSGFKIYNLDFKEQCSNTILKINEFLENNKEEKNFTKKEKRKLELQLEKNKAWLKDENLDELFPSKIFISMFCAIRNAVADPIAILTEIISSKFVDIKSVKKIPIKKPTKTITLAIFFPYALLARSVTKKVTG